MPLLFSALIPFPFTWWLLRIHFGTNLNCEYGLINFSFYKIEIFLLKVLTVNGMFLKALECFPQTLFFISIDNYIKNGSHFSESKLKIQWEKMFCMRLLCITVLTWEDPKELKLVKWRWCKFISKLIILCLIDLLSFQFSLIW